MLITVKVKTGAKKFAIAAKDGILHISLTEPAENNRANAELVKEMTRKFGRAQKAKLSGSAGNFVSVRCKIVRGLKSKTKTLEIPDGSDLESLDGTVR